MMRCLFCGLVFPHPHMDIRGRGTVGLSGITEDCIRCGGASVQIENGRFEIDEAGNFTRIVEALTSASATRQDYTDLAALLQNAQDLGLPPEAIADAIESNIPNLAGVGRALLRVGLGNQAQAAYALLALIISFLAYFYPRQPPAEPASPPSVTVVVNQPSEEEARRWIEETLQAQAKPSEQRDRELIDEAVKKALAAQAKKRGHHR